jgi:hypothetical protein
MTGVLTAVQILGGLLTPVVASLALYIAWQQHRTARDKVKLDLFDRRYRVYRGLMDLFAAVAADGTVSDEGLGKFYRKTDQKRFIFDADIRDYLDEVRQKVVKLRQAHRVLAGASTSGGPPVHHDFVMGASASQAELLSWFEDEIDRAGRKFEPYLGFKKQL